MPSLDELLSQLKESEELLSFPSVSGHVERANTLLISIARNAPSGEIAELARRVASAANAVARGLQPRDEAGISRLLWRLRLALQEAKRDAS